jgi:hypothetical protein
MKLLCDTGTNDVLASVDEIGMQPGLGLILCDVPVGYDDEPSLWKHDNGVVVKRTGQDYQDAFDKNVKPKKQGLLKSKYELAGKMELLPILAVLDKLVDGQSPTNAEKQALKKLAQALKKANQDMEADPEWPGA